MSEAMFTVKGKAGGRDVVIGWAEGVFDDPTGRVEVLIAAIETVCATPTGPCYIAGRAPGQVALLTAIHALDEVTEVEGGDEYAATLVELTTIPDGATA